MKRALKILAAAYLLLAILAVPVKLYAIDDSTKLMNLCGFDSSCARQVTTIVNTLASPFTNNSWLTVRNAANSGNINVLKVDGSDETWLNADTGDTIKLGVAGTAELTVGDDSLTFSGAAGTIAGGATSLALSVNGATKATATTTGVTIASGNTLKLDLGTIAAAGSTNADATAVADQLTYVTASDGTKGVILPESTGTGAIYIIHNTVNAQNLKVYPDASGQINGGTATTGNVVVAGEETGFFIDAGTNVWYGGVAVDF